MLANRSLPDKRSLDRNPVLIGQNSTTTLRVMCSRVRNHAIFEFIVRALISPALGC
jgi:hypothetical protein